MQYLLYEKQKNRETKQAARVINAKAAVIENAATLAVLFCNNCQIILSF